MSPVTRFQGAIIRNDHILLVKHRENASGRTFWVIPGGGREKGETEQECVRREIREETHLNVAVKQLLLDEAGHPDDVYRRFRTYLCVPLGGEAYPGCEPEFAASQAYAITQVGWFDLRDEAAWGTEVIADPFAYPMLQRIQAALGYKADE
ncbi:MAG: NUDIX domain-containing protein [Anaerolineae bacterium]|jgi:ADP-ribose pyrophosphatase YjhB (NUDIX family)